MRFHSIMLAVAAGCVASAASAQQSETGYPKGALAAEAIAAAEYATAEAQLREEFRVPQDDPGRLINFGHVLLKTGRHAEAAQLFRQASEADNVELILADGRIMGSREAARRALQSTSVGGPFTDEK
jgi:Flp pilus assembly protein TadD